MAGVRKIQADSTRNKLIRTATEMIQNASFEQNTVVEIAKQSGLSVGTFYHYFPSKEALFLLIGETLCNNIDEELLNRSGTNPLDDLLWYMSEWVAVSKKLGPHYERFFYSVSGTDVDFDRRDSGEPSIMQQRFTAVAKRLNAAVASKQLASDAPIESIAQTVIMLLAGSSVLSYTTSGALGIDQLHTVSQNVCEQVVRPYLL